MPLLGKVQRNTKNRQKGTCLDLRPASAIYILGIM